MAIEAKPANLFRAVRRTRRAAKPKVGLSHPAAHTSFQGIAQAGAEEGTVPWR